MNENAGQRDPELENILMGDPPVVEPFYRNEKLKDQMKNIKEMLKKAKDDPGNFNTDQEKNEERSYEIVDGLRVRVVDENAEYKRPTSEEMAIIYVWQPLVSYFYGVIEPLNQAAQPEGDLRNEFLYFKTIFEQIRNRLSEDQPYITKNFIESVIPDNEGENIFGDDGNVVQSKFTKR